MENTLRLIFPQWQGAESGNIANYVRELAPQEAAQGYVLGAQLLQWLAPAHAGSTATVPVSLASDADATKTEAGIFSRAAVLRQLRCALDILAVHAPAKIATLGGECSVSVAPFTYLAARYADDLAVLWLDAHPDLRVPHEDYTGFHAMALAAVLGQGDADITAVLPASVPSQRALIVGLRSPEGGDMQRPGRFGVHWLPSEAVNEAGGDAVLQWLRQCGARHVAVHLDLDAMEPTELRVAVASDAHGLRIAPTAALLQRIAREFNLVGLTVAEPMPREAILLRRLLHALPLLGADGEVSDTP